MRAAVIVLAVATLIAIGSAEAWISNDQLSHLPGRARPALSGSGAALTLVGVALSAAVYVILGYFLARDGGGASAALGIGMAVGAAAGLIGGAIRASLIRDYLGDVLADYGLGNLLIVTLAVFVVLAIAVSVAAGAIFTWLGCRYGRRPTRPLPS